MIVIIAQVMLIMGLVGGAIAARVLHGAPYPRRTFNAWPTIGLAALELLLCIASWGWLS